MACLHKQIIEKLLLPLQPFRRRRRCICTTNVLLLLICSSLSGFTQGKSPCKCSGDSNNLDLGDPSLAWKTVTYDRVDQDGYLFRTDSGTLLLGAAQSIISPHSVTLSSFRNDPSSSKLPGLYIPWGYIWYGGTFRLTFNMSVYSEPSATASSRNNNLILAILPGYDFDGGGQKQPMPIHPADNSWSSGQQDGSSSSSLQMGACTWPVYGVSTGCVKIPIDPVAGSSVMESFVVYDPLGKRLSASVGEAARNPDAPYAVAASMAMDLSQLLSWDDRPGQIGLFSSVGQLAQLQAWNLTVDRPLHKGGGTPWVVILSSVLGSVAATAVAAAAVYLYLNSRYRRWKKDLDQLSRTMQSLPGVLMQVDFAFINKATDNFSETMKLGKGGFGAVYGCTLPAPASATRTTTTGQAMKVAVKKFTRDLSDRRYEDFLAEVSIINCLRHKNVVPLVGWSYNKGEPLLIYEYMENGSLDQHLFHDGGGSGGGQWQRQTAAIEQWDTRYGIARDIATGLHYIHHEHEPMVLHRDIKASNIMLDSAFCARLGDFGIACTVAPERSSVTGFAGTIGYIAPECIIKWKATRQTDVYAFGVLVLELISGKKNSSADIPADDGHISYWVWRLHREGTLLEAIDGAIISGKNHQPRHVIEEEAKRLLLLGLACTNPNPSSRPSMIEVIQVINKVTPPPEVSLERPTLGWIPEECSLATASSEHGAADANQVVGCSKSTIELV